MAYAIVVIGASTGGLKALQTLLSHLPEDFSLPVVIVQHRGKDSESGLCDFLARSSRIPLTEPEDKDALLSGHAYLAPRDYHMLIENGSVALSTDPPVGFARPSIDVLFEAAAAEYKERTIGVILTGANRDGVRGLGGIKSQGGATLVEDPTSATCSELPEAAVRLVQPDWVLPLQEIASCLQRLTIKSEPRTEHHVI